MIEVFKLRFINLSAKVLFHLSINYTPINKNNFLLNKVTT